MLITQSDFNKNLNKNFFFEKFPKIAVAVSGGPDSMALAFLLKNWVLKNNGSLLALIVDHQVRKDSNLEAKNIKKYLIEHKIESKLFKINKKNVIKKNMNEARKNRFNQLFNFCNRQSIFHLFVGHHFDDNLETYLLRKLAGSNFEGLRCMQQKFIIENIQILRPLLLYNKKNILLYNESNNISYVKDPSNKNLKYSRIVVREFLLNKNEFIQQIKKEFDVIKNYFPKYKKMIFDIFNKISIDISKNKILINSNILTKYDFEIQIKIVEIIYKFLKPKKINLRYRKILDFIELINSREILSSNLGGMSIKKDVLLISFLS
jgi:tRNA(Ile)-lysidine synthase